MTKRSTVMFTSHRASRDPSDEERWSRLCGDDSLLTLTLALSLYNLSSSWTKWVSSSPGLRVTPHTGQHDGSAWNFFLPGEQRMLLRQNAVSPMVHGPGH